MSPAAAVTISAVFDFSCCISSWSFLSVELVQRCTWDAIYPESRIPPSHFRCLRRARIEWQTAFSRDCLGICVRCRVLGRLTNRSLRGAIVMLRFPDTSAAARAISLKNDPAGQEAQALPCNQLNHTLIRLVAHLILLCWCFWLPLASRLCLWQLLPALCSQQLFACTC